MDVLLTCLASIIVATVTGAFSYWGVSKSVKTSHDQMLTDLKASQEKFSLVTEHQIREIQNDIVRLEQKQDKHNSIIERTFKLEQKVEDIEKRFD